MVATAAVINRIVCASTPTPSSAVSKPFPHQPSNLPLRPIPGSYGLPLLGPIADRLDYFWFQGPETFFKTRMEKHKSSVFRTNIPPSFPFLGGVNPNVVSVLDCKSFAHLFDMEVVEKRDVLIGDFMPSVKFTGGIRVGVYLDPSEPQHAKTKKFALEVLKSSSKVWVSELTSNLDTLFDGIETSLTEKGSSASYIFPLQQCLFKFLVKALIGADPALDPEISKSGYAMLDRWLALQILPTVKIGVLQPLEEILLHSFPYPFALVSGDYGKLYNFIEKYGSEVVQRGENEFGLTASETIHNLLFILGFNAFGGFSVFLPTLIGNIASDKSGLQSRLREEVKQKISTGSVLNFESVKDLELVKSVVYETLRFSPPVPLQFGRARKDFRLSSHDSVYEIKKGELLCGYQTLVMRDQRVFDEPDTFKPDRFMGEDGLKLLDYLYWSNGPQTGTPTESNKQCAAKDIVTLTACLIVAYIFKRYESFTGDASSITAIEKAK